MIQYREMSVDDVRHLAGIDRSEHIDAFYRVVGGTLSLTHAEEDAPSWSDAVLAAYEERLSALLTSGGRAVGAWEDARFIGFASLDPTAVGGDPTVLQLDMLYVSREDRGRGIGRALTETVVDLARSLGATTLYISATPTRGTVDAYLRMGAVLLETPDPALFEREPEDIHLAYRFRCHPTRPQTASARRTT